MLSLTGSVVLSVVWRSEFGPNAIDPQYHTMVSLFVVWSHWHIDLFTAYKVLYFPEYHI